VLDIVLNPLKTVRRIAKRSGITHG
jgi:hypothetical protein